MDSRYLTSIVCVSVNSSVKIVDEKEDADFYSKTCFLMTKAKTLNSRSMSGPRSRFLSSRTLKAKDIFQGLYDCTPARINS